MARQYQHSDARRQQIAEAALQVIAKDGLGHFTTRAIASRVGITDGTLFRHFRNKNEIVLAAMDLLEAQMFAAEPSGHGDTLDRLEWLFRHRAAFVGAQGAVGRLIFSDQLVHVAGPDGRARLQRWQRHKTGLLTRCFGELEAQGRLVDGVQVADAVRLLQGQVITFAVRRMVAGDVPCPLDEEIEQSWKTLRHLLIR